MSCLAKVLYVSLCDVNVGSWIGSFFSNILLSKIRPSKIPWLASHNPKEPARDGQGSHFKAAPEGCALPGAQGLHTCR